MARKPSERAHGEDVEAELNLVPIMAILVILIPVLLYAFTFFEVKVQAVAAPRLGPAKKTEKNKDEDKSGFGEHGKTWVFPKDEHTVDKYPFAVSRIMCSGCSNLSIPLMDHVDPNWNQKKDPKKTLFANCAARIRTISNLLCLRHARNSNLVPHVTEP